MYVAWFTLDRVVTGTWPFSTYLDTGEVEADLKTSHTQEGVDPPEEGQSCPLPHSRRTWGRGVGLLCCSLCKTCLLIKGKIKMR